MLERRHVRRRVDAASEPGGDDETFEAKLGGDLTGEFLPDGRAVARADNGDDRDVGELQPALDVEQRRRRIDLGKRRRIARLADGDQGGAEPVRRFEFGLGLGFRAEMDVAAAAAPRQQRQSGEAASAPPNSLTRPRKVAGPTFSLRISRSQATR